jgi:hypothetical protein
MSPQWEGTTGCRCNASHTDCEQTCPRPEGADNPERLPLAFHIIIDAYLSFSHAFHCHGKSSLLHIITGDNLSGLEDASAGRHTFGDATVELTDSSDENLNLF